MDGIRELLSAILIFLLFASPFIAWSIIGMIFALIGASKRSREEGEE